MIPDLEKETLFFLKREQVIKNNILNQRNHMVLSRNLGGHHHKKRTDSTASHEMGEGAVGTL